ncbi:serine/threonine-protein kinase [Stieleria marina]|uniref:non-specific serine/threonine protein kinase n=1 Tax=Stieleria marina TaxID=1930275 RepID=A0A517P0X8_9BACT|nr:Serine/threonine-protein kinase PknB [Planctomycetes bacterium K23_9]
MNPKNHSASNDDAPSKASLSGSSNSQSTTRSGVSLIGSRLGDYQVLRKLGKGGMADVYAARHLSLGRDVAIKVLRSDYAKDKDYISRFRREARAAAKLNHSSIVQVYDVGSVDQTHFIAQELIKGQNLKEVLTTRGPLTTEEATEVLISVGSALEAAAEVGITHRDIKPENIMRSARGDIKVADFGLARLGADSEASRSDLTQAGLTMGTPRYMSPEQVQGKVVDVRSDMYSLGVSMYHLLSGRPPFEADDPLALAVLHLHETPQPLDRARGNDDLPEWLIAVVTRLMSKLPGDRFQSPSELLSAVRNQSSMATDKAYGAIGTAAATIRLQRATDAAVSKRRRGYLRWAIALSIPLICGSAALAMSLRNPPRDVGELLKPPLAVKADTIEEQFLIAVARNDVASWAAIPKHFPPNESSKNRNYFAKSLVQLSRVYASQEKKEEAVATLDRLLGDPKVDRKYRLVAWAKRAALLETMNDPAELQKSLNRLESLYDELKTANPSSIEFFDRVIPPTERMQLEIGGGRDT